MKILYETSVVFVSYKGKILQFSLTKHILAHKQ